MVHLGRDPVLPGLGFSLTRALWNTDFLLGTQAFSISGVITGTEQPIFYQGVTGCHFKIYPGNAG